METDPRRETPLFLLGTVLFPGGDLPLRVFEPRYTDMVASAMRSGTRFAIAAISEGSEVGDAAAPSGVATEVDLVDFEPGEAGSLNIVVRGVHKVEVHDSHVQSDKLVVGSVSTLPDEPEIGIPAAHADTVALLRAVLEKTQDWSTGEHTWQDDAAWVGGRLVERLPIDLVGKQQLLEMQDPLARLSVLSKVAALMRA